MSGHNDPMDSLAQSLVEDRRTPCITLGPRDGASLSGARKAFGPLMPTAKLRQVAPRQIQLTMAGLELEGKILDPKKQMQMLYTCCGAARVRTELNNLRPRQPDDLSVTA